MLSTPLVISVGEARKILGKQADELEDDQIIDVILSLTDIATTLLQQDYVPRNE
jgi:hypothetical protein